ncbi:unnamed protein product, partial [Vitis vinifera]
MTIGNAVSIRRVEVGCPLLCTSDQGFHREKNGRNHPQDRGDPSHGGRAQGGGGEAQGRGARAWWIQGRGARAWWIQRRGSKDMDMNTGLLGRRRRRRRRRSTSMAMNMMAIAAAAATATRPPPTSSLLLPTYGENTY